MKTTLETVLEFQKTIRQQKRQALDQTQDILLKMVKQLFEEPYNPERIEKAQALLLAVEFIDQAKAVKAENLKTNIF